MRIVNKMQNKKHKQKNTMRANKTIKINQKTRNRIKISYNYIKDTVYGEKFNTTCKYC